MKTQNLEAEWKSEHLQSMAVVCVRKQERNVLASYSASFCGTGQFSSTAIQTEHSHQSSFEQKDFPFTLIQIQNFCDDFWIQEL